MINNEWRLEHKLTKTIGLTRQKTFQNKNYIDLDFDLDKDISEMNVNIKEYKTINKKNLFLENKIPVKKELKLINKLYRINTIKNKNYDCYSITTNSSYNDKNVKKVTFSTIEIIRVEKYKKHNAKNNFSKIAIQKNMEEIKKNQNNDGTTCFIF